MAALTPAPCTDPEDATSENAVPADTPCHVNLADAVCGGAAREPADPVARTPRSRIALRLILWLAWGTALLLGPALVYSNGPGNLTIEYYLWTSALPLSALCAALAFAFRERLAPTRRRIGAAALACTLLYAGVLALWLVCMRGGAFEILRALSGPEWLLRYACWMLWGALLPLGILPPRAEVAPPEPSNLLAELDGSEALTARERQVTCLLLDGLSVPQAARRLGISASTVSTYRARACEKLGVERFDELCVETGVAPAAATSAQAGDAAVIRVDVPTRAGAGITVAALCLGTLLAPALRYLGSLEGFLFLVLIAVPPLIGAAVAQRLGAPLARLRPTGRLAMLVTGALIAGAGIGMAPGFANFGIAFSAYRTIVGGPVIALAVYLAACAVAWHGALTEPADAPGALDEERCLLYLRGRGAGELQARSLLRIAQGRSTEEICRELCVARGTVNAYRARGYALLHIHTRRELSDLLQRDTGVAPAPRMCKRR